MRVEYENDRIIFRFEAPATVEMPEDALVVPSNSSIREVFLDFKGVKIISSMVIARLLMLIDQQKGKKRIVMINVGEEMKRLFLRTGLDNLLDYVQDTN